MDIYAKKRLPLIVLYMNFNNCEKKLKIRRNKKITVVKTECKKIMKKTCHQVHFLPETTRMKKSCKKDN